MSLQGYGTNFFKEDEYFEGEWYANKRSGWGRMYYADGSVYEGEWFNDMREGTGMLRLGETGFILSKMIMLHEIVGQKKKKG